MNDSLGDIKTEAREKARKFLHAQVANKENHGAGWDERQLIWLMVSFWQRGKTDLTPKPGSDDEVERWLANNYGPHVNTQAWTWIKELRELALKFVQRMPASACAATISYITEAFGSDQESKSIVDACWRRLVFEVGVEQATYEVFGNTGPDQYIDEFLSERG